MSARRPWVCFYESTCTRVGAVDKSAARREAARVLKVPKDRMRRLRVYQVRRP